MNKTNWDLYYQKPYKIAHLSRHIMGTILVRHIKKYFSGKKITIMELGGANSCFYDVIQNKIAPEHFYIMDNNSYGLNKFTNLKQNHPSFASTTLINNNILLAAKVPNVDLVFSIGLVEHFSEPERLTAIRNHFNYLKSGGFVILSFPTPTLAYKTIRSLAEFCNLWIFHDEQPIHIKEALSIFSAFAHVIEYKIIWSIGLTQAFFILQKK